MTDPVTFRALMNTPKKTIQGPFIELRDDGFVSSDTQSFFEYKMSARIPRSTSRNRQIYSELEAIWKMCKTTDRTGHDQAADIGMVREPSDLMQAIMPTMTCSYIVISLVILLLLCFDVTADKHEFRSRIQRNYRIINGYGTDYYTKV